MDIKYATPADGESVEPLFLSSERVDWLEEIWSRVELAPKVRNALIEIDRQLRGIHAIADVMRADRQCRMLRDDFEGFAYDPLRPALLDGLECALQSMLDQVDQAMDKLRTP